MTARDSTTPVPELDRLADDGGLSAIGALPNKMNTFARALERREAWLRWPNTQAALIAMGLVR